MYTQVTGKQHLICPNSVVLFKNADEKDHLRRSFLPWVKEKKLGKPSLNMVFAATQACINGKTKKLEEEQRRCLFLLSRWH